jgi:hypothetical protein
MGDYLRTTRECTLDSLHSLQAKAMRAHVEKYELGDIEKSILICCETVSTKKKKGFLNAKAEVILTSMLLTPQWLIWAAGKENEIPGVLSARLHELRVRDYEKSDLNKLVADTGLDISGLRTDTVEVGSAFIGLGSEPAAQKFRTILTEMVAKAQV